MTERKKDGIVTAATNSDDKTEECNQDASYFPQHWRNDKEPGSNERGGDPELRKDNVWVWTGSMEFMRICGCGMYVLFCV